MCSDAALPPGHAVTKSIPTSLCPVTQKSSEIKDEGFTIVIRIINFEVLETLMFYYI